MKKYFYLLSLSLFASFIVKAQNVPNGDFENWTNHGTYSNPVSWNTTDSISSTFGQHSVLQETGMVYTGTSAMKMQTWVYSGVINEPGAATNGTENPTTILPFEGGTPDSTRHEILTGWYIYNPAGGDSCLVSVLLTKWNGSTRDTIGLGIWSTKDTAIAYTEFTLNINYLNTGNPDTVLIVIASAPLGIGTAHQGTILYIDDLNFSGVNGINSLSASSFSVNAYPNPASGFLTVEAKGNAPVKGSISILDLSGKFLQSIPMTDKKQRIDISALANGNYLYELVDEKGIKFYSGKFSVSH